MKAFLRSSTGALLAALLVVMATGTVKAQVADLDRLPIGDAVELVELQDRWREITADDPARPTPYSQTGIDVLVRGLLAIYALPAEARAQKLAALRQGKLDELLPVDELSKYCAETTRLAGLVADAASGPIVAKLSAQIVHAAPVLAALQSVLIGVLDDLDPIASPDEATVLVKVREALGEYAELQQARAALDLVAGASPGATKLLGTALGTGAPIEQLVSRLPAVALPELRLCRLADEPWPPLPELDPRVGEQWRRVEAAFDAFAAASSAQLQAIIGKATAEVAGFAPLKQFVEPALDVKRTSEQLRSWRIGFEYAAALAEERGLVELIAINDSLGLSVPLGITVAGVSRTQTAEGIVSLHFVRDAILQTGTVDTAVLQSGLGAIGLPEWAHISEVELRVADNLWSVSLMAKIEIEALGIELSHPIVLHDGSRVIDFEADIKHLVDQLALMLADRLRAAAPNLSTAWGPVKLVVKTVTPARVVINEPWQLTIAGEIAAPFGAAVSIGVELILGESSQTPFRIVSATASPDLEMALLGSVNDSFDTILDGLNNAAPPEARPYLAGCLALREMALHAGTSTALDLSLSVDAGGVAHNFAIASPDLAQLGTKLVEEVAGDVGACITRELTLYLARAALGLTPDQVQAYLEALNQIRINLMGLEFEVANVQPPADKRGFIFDLVGEAAGGQVRFGRLELRIDLWQPGQPLAAAALDFSAATISPEDVRRLLIAVTRLPERLLDRVDVAFQGGVLVVTPKLTIEALGGEIAVPPISLRPEMTLDAVRDSVLDAADLVIGQLLQARLGNMLADIGPIESVALDGANSKFLPVGGQDAELALKVRTRLDFFVVLWTVTLTIDAEGRSSVKIEAGAVEDQLLEQLTAFLGDALNGIVPGTPENITVLTSAPYGVSFDLSANVGGFAATIKGVKVTTEGLQLSSRLKLEYRQPPGVPIPPAFQALPVEISIDLEELANFEIGAFITFAADSYGVLGLDARLRGEGGGKRLATEGVVKVLQSLPLVKSTGVVDFSEKTIVMRTQTVGEIARLLDIGEQIVITAEPMQAEMAARVNALGVEAIGHLRVAVDGKQARITLGGTADLLLGKAEVNAVLDSRMRGTGVSGTIDTFAGSASLTVTAGAAQAELNVHGFRIKLIAPSVRQLTRGLLEEALRRLFDFRFSWDSLKNREIVISLLDPYGRTNTDPVGGDPSSGKADDAEAAGDDPAAPPPATPDATGGGDAAGRGAAPAGCGLPNSTMVASESTFPGHVVEMTGPENHTYFYWHESRAAPVDAWEALKALPQVGCFTFDDLDAPHFSPDGYDVASPLVQVFVGEDNQPQVMVWRKDQRPVALAYSGEEWSIALNGGDPAQAFQLARDGLVAQGFVRRVLRMLVARTIEQMSERIVDAVRVVPTVMEGVGVGSEHGVIALVTSNGRPVLRIFAGTAADENGASPDVAENDPLFQLLATAEQRKGPLGQLLVAATVAGQKLRVLHAQDQCTLVTADSVSKGAWEARIFAVTPTAILPAQVAAEARTEDMISSEATGDLVCAALLGSDGSPRWEALSGGSIDGAAAVFAFARGLSTPDWSVRMTVRPAPNGGEAPPADSFREATRKEIEDKLLAWTVDGLVVDDQLGGVPLDATGVLLLLDTLVLPEEDYLERLQVNPRGLL